MGLNHQYTVVIHAVVHTIAIKTGDSSIKLIILNIIVIGSEKRDHFTEFSFFKAYTIAAMNLNFGMNILPSSCYTRKEFRVPPTSGLGGAITRVDRVRKSPFYASLWLLTIQDNRLALPSNVGSVK